MPNFIDPPPASAKQHLISNCWYILINLKKKEVIDMLDPIGKSTYSFVGFRGSMRQICHKGPIPSPIIYDNKKRI
jgi:hypothetical protein